MKKPLTHVILFVVLYGLLVLSFTKKAYADPNDWLDVLNYYREMAKLGPVYEDASLSKTPQSWIENVVNKDIQGTHFDKGIASRTGFPVEKTKFIEDFFATVYHGVPLLDPQLATVGIGYYADWKAPVASGIAMDVTSGVDNAMKPTYPIFFPGDGTYMPLWNFGTGKEDPDPLKFCPGYAGLVGPPIFLQTGDGSSESDVTSRTFLENGKQLEHCILDADGAIVLLPKSPLKQGHDYDVSINAKGKKYEWSFTTMRAKLRGNILWRDVTTPGHIVAWIMNGNTMQSVTWFWNSYWCGPNCVNNGNDSDWRIVATADFNNDGETDILWRHSKAGYNKIQLMDGMTAIEEFPLPYVTDPNWEVIGSGDFNYDGRMDILWRNNITGNNRVWLMDVRTAAFVSQLVPEVMKVVDIAGSSHPDWEMAGVGDFDGDFGGADILWRNSKSGQLAVWKMSGTNFWGEFHFLETVPDLNWKIVAIGDFNDDGKPDILWRHVWGFIGVWYMDGYKHTSGAYVDWAHPNWEIVGTGIFH